MNDIELDEEDREIEELRKQAEEAQAREEAEPVEEPQPEPEAEPEAEEPKEAAQAEEPQPEDVIPEEKPKEDDPLEYVKKKGLTTPEAIARSYRELEKKWHEGNQKRNGSQNGNPAPQPETPAWQPRPDYQPSMPSRDDIIKKLATSHNIDPEDAQRLVPFVAELASAVVRQNLTPLQGELSTIRGETARNAELFQLMQDPAFSNPYVVQEMHKVFEENPQLLNVQGGKTQAFNMAIGNIGRKQLQQVNSTKTAPKSRPPVTAGGGNGSQKPQQNVRDFRNWTLDQQEAYLKKYGSKLPVD